MIFWFPSKIAFFPSLSDLISPISCLIEILGGRCNAKVLLITGQYLFFSFFPYRVPYPRFNVLNWQGPRKVGGVRDERYKKGSGGAASSSLTSLLNSRTLLHSHPQPKTKTKPNPKPQPKCSLKSSLHLSFLLSLLPPLSRLLRKERPTLVKLPISLPALVSLPYSTLPSYSANLCHRCLRMVEQRW